MGAAQNEGSIPFARLIPHCESLTLQKLTKSELSLRNTFKVVFNCTDKARSIGPETSEDAALRHFVQATGNQIGLNSDSGRIHAVHGLHQPFQ
jgi:hypothetical protein